MNKYRIEKDSLGEIAVPSEMYYGAQTQRALENFPIQNHLMPIDQILSMVMVKKACAIANHQCGVLPTNNKELIVWACDEILSGKYHEQFVLSVYQSGSGTQSNMNVNEVIAHLANEKAGAALIHPNDDVNKSQSTNDVFPSAMHLTTHQLLSNRVLPALDQMINQLSTLEDNFKDILKAGRTHLQDATNLTLGQEFSGYVSGLLVHRQLIIDSLKGLEELALGGSAVGTGINTPQGYLEALESAILEVTGTNYRVHNNKFEQLSLKIGMVHTASTIKSLTTSLYKIVNDLRFMSSGPRLGYGELSIPANEPGSSIMPGKVNPTQCESMLMVLLNVSGNMDTLMLANSQGNFELNVMMPLMIEKMVISTHLLSDSINSFTDNCLIGLRANEEKLKQNVEANLMSATSLNPILGYEVVAEIVKEAYESQRSFKEVGIEKGKFSEEEYEAMMVKQHEQL